MPLTAGPEIRVNTTTAGSQQAPDLTSLTDNTYVAVWSQPGADPSTTDFFAQRFDASGAMLGTQRFLASTPGQGVEASVAPLSTGGYVMAYSSGGRVFASRFHENGDTLYGPLTTGTNAARDVSVAQLPDGGFAVAWVEQAGRDTTVMTQAFTIGGQPISPPKPAHTGQTSTGMDGNTYGSVISDPVLLGLPDGGYVVAYEVYTRAGGGMGLGSIKGEFTLPYAVRYDAAGQRTGYVELAPYPSPAEISRHWADVSIASDGDRLLFAWSYRDNKSTEPPQIQVRSFDLNLGSDGGTRFVGTGTEPDVAAAADGFWVSHTTNGSPEIALVRVDDMGHQLQPAIVVNNYRTGTQADSDLERVAGDRFVAVWRSDQQDGDGGGIYLRQLNGDDTRPQISAEGGAIVRTVYEKHLSTGTEPNLALTRATGEFTIAAADGIEDLFVGGQFVIQDGHFTETTVVFGSNSTLTFTSYSAATGKLTWQYGLNNPQNHAVVDGPHPRTLTQQVVITLRDGDGDTTSAEFRFNVVDDAPVLGADFDTATPGGPAATGNVITDAAPGDAGDGDNGADRLGADAGRLVAVDVGGGPGRAVFPNGSASIQGEHGLLTLQANGDYSYVADFGAPVGAADVFRYWVADSDGSPGVSQVLNVTIGQGSGSGQVINSPGPGSTLRGGDGADTLNASQGPDVLIGGGGADVFAYKALPWNAGHITDFALGSDRLDLSALFQASGYTGTNPVADGRVRLDSDGAGGTRVYFDRDAPNTGDWPFLITTLDGIPQSGLTWAQLSGGSGGGPPPTSGQVINSPGPGSTLQGGNGNDTLNASQGPDVLTGGGGGDAFVYSALPWNAGRVTDFLLGTDRLDLSAIFQASGYSGADPVADGRMRLESDGAGGTRVFFDRDAPNAGDWPFLVTTLQDVSPTGLTWAQLSGGGAPPPTGGQVINSPGPGSTLQGGAGADTLNASQGPDQLTGGGGADHFAWAALPWNAGHVTDFTPGVDKLDLRALFQASGYAGSNPLADGRLEFRGDGQGNTQVYFDRDGPGAGDWPFLITTLDAVQPSQIGAGDWLFR